MQNVAGKIHSYLFIPSSDDHQHVVGICGSEHNVTLGLILLCVVLFQQRRRASVVSQEWIQVSNHDDRDCCFGISNNLKVSHFLRRHTLQLFFMKYLNKFQKRWFYFQKRSCHCVWWPLLSRRFKWLTVSWLSVLQQQCLSWVYRARMQSVLQDCGYQDNHKPVRCYSSLTSMNRYVTELP